MATVSARSLTGTGNDRADNDFYATPLSATEKLLKFENIFSNELGNTILEPAAGMGHISNVLKTHYPNANILSTDLIKRDDKFNVDIISGIDFLSFDYKTKFDTVITNPPFSLIDSFIKKALDISTQKVIMLARIQLLEGIKRHNLFKTTPLKYVYVHSQRIKPMKNGNEKNDDGTTLQRSTICFAWFVWEHGYNGEPKIRWIL